MKASLWTYTACVSLLMATEAHGLKAPASDLPDDEYAEYEEDVDGVAPMESDQDDSSNEGEEEEDNWESYSDLTTYSSVAEDITDGVRVEDIVEPPSEYRYAAFGKPDPFVPPLITQASQLEIVDTPGAIEIPIVSPLQKHDLSTLRVVGIYSVPNGYRKALVITPDAAKIAVTVKIGDPIGNRGGKVLAIGPKTVTIREFMLGQDGTRQYDDLEMFLGVPDDRATGARIRFEPGSNKTTIIENSDVVKAVETGVEEKLGDGLLSAKETAQKTLNQESMEAVEKKAEPWPGLPVEKPASTLVPPSKATPDGAPGTTGGADATGGDSTTPEKKSASTPGANDFGGGAPSEGEIAAAVGNITNATAEGDKTSAADDYDEYNY